MCYCLTKEFSCYNKYWTKTKFQKCAYLSLHFNFDFKVWIHSLLTFAFNLFFGGEWLASFYRNCSTSKSSFDSGAGDDEFSAVEFPLLNLRLRLLRFLFCFGGPSMKETISSNVISSFVCLFFLELEFKSVADFESVASILF